MRYAILTALTLILLATGVYGQAERPALAPGSVPALVGVNSQKSLAECVGEGFGDADWVRPEGLLPRGFSEMTYVSGPGDADLSPKAAWRKPVVLRDKDSGVVLHINCYRPREKPPAAVAGTPFEPLMEANYQYEAVKFHGLAAASARMKERDVFAFVDGDILFKIEAVGGKDMARQRVAATVAEAIWQARHSR